MFGRIFRTYGKVARVQKDVAFGLAPMLLGMFGGIKGKVAAFALRRAKPSVDRTFDSIWGGGGSPKRKLGRSKRRRF